MSQPLVFYAFDVDMSQSSMFDASDDPFISPMVGTDLLGYQDFFAHAHHALSCTTEHVLPVPLVYKTEPTEPRGPLVLDSDISTQHTPSLDCVVKELSGLLGFFGFPGHG